ncbi:MAG: DNA-directed polymerase subunit [Candidatus Methanomethylophilaceae archaeon]|nr:DNA-directed polymerase subunit [Candidatus Methanomethylophilaceae archaeon]MDI3541396.1 DNA-directed polymerase subunit [Candidatus Methanomethylophilaceae archaeon]
MMRGVSKRIGAIKFSCISPEEIRKMSATKIITADTYDDDGFPIDMGLMDPHLGVIEPGLRCKTCGHKVDECPGHFGHIDLAMPVIHVGFVKDIKRLLQATCRSCGRILLTEDQIEEYRSTMEAVGEQGGTTDDFKLLSKETSKDASAKPICPYCGAEQLKITLDKPTTFREDGHKLTPKEVRERLERIPDNDLIPLGIDPQSCRPEWMVLTALAVPPVTVRPSITLESGDRSEDDLTHKLVDVLRINQRLRENRDAGAPQLIVEDLWELLQYHVTTYFDNQTSGIPPARHRSGRPLKTLVQRLKGKEGRFRSNLSGKRVNFSARTVISPDPMLSINEVGVPVVAARELTVPVHVNRHNIETLRAMVAAGPEPKGEGYQPGVNYVIRSDGRRIRVTEHNAEMVAEALDVDYTVERQLMDGDVVLFNRQPSLHRMSMMAHRVRVMGGKTFRFNLCVCPPYNADFDGDEMNLHVLQSDEARAEARIIMQVQENILSPRYGGPIIGAIHDHITGLFYLTHNNPRFNKEETLNILSKFRNRQVPEPIVEDGVEYWTGKMLFSLVLPPDFRATFKASICQMCRECKKEECEHDAYVKIRNGQLLTGTIDAKAVGNSKGKILDRIARDYGSERARIFIDQVTRLALGAIMNRGFTTGIDDEDIPEEAKLQIAEFNRVSVEKVSELVQSFREGTLDQLPGRSLEETLELEVMKVLGQARDEAGRIAGKYLGMENSAVVMARSGARGSMLNLSQMAGCVGQQAVRGERLSRGYWGRTLPHFEKGDLGAAARGFVSSSYKSGLSPTEFFFHAMGGREGLVDTAVRTSRSGYMQRRLVSAMEDLKLMPNGTVRNTADTVIQFRYGEDGVDPARAVQGKAVDLEEVFAEVLGDEAEHLLHVEEPVGGEDYATKEKDEMEFFEETEDVEELDFGGDE